MKKQVAVFFLVLTLAFPCYAANKLKYKTVDGEIVAMGAMPNLSAGLGEAVVTVEDAIPSTLSEYTFNGSGLVKKPQAVINAEVQAKKDKKTNAYEKVKSKLSLTDEEMAIMGFLK
jgi:hypothetical protein